MSGDKLFHEVSFNEFTRVAPYIIDAGFPIMLRGRHGIGKSELVYYLAETHCKLPVVERRASQMDVGDLVGLPILTKGLKGTEVTSFAPPDWLRRACDEPVCLFLDEVDRATLEVAQGIFELCDSRKIYGNTLHEGTKVFAAVNGGASGNEYQVREMDPAELDRWAVFDLKPTVEDWMKWAEVHGKVENLVLEFLGSHREHLEHIGGHDASVVYPSRRSWVRFDRILKRIGDFHTFVGLENIGTSVIGFSGAVAFGEFVRTYNTAVTFEDVLAGKKKKKWDQLDFEQFNMIGRHLKHEAPDSPDFWRANEMEQPEASSKQMNNLREFLLVCPDEILINVTRLCHPFVATGLVSGTSKLTDKKRKSAADKKALLLMSQLKTKLKEATTYMAEKVREKEEEAKKEASS
jgi:hypothetical protein